MFIFLQNVKRFLPRNYDLKVPEVKENWIHEKGEIQRSDIFGFMPKGGDEHLLI